MKTLYEILTYHPQISADKSAGPEPSLYELIEHYYGPHYPQKMVTKLAKEYITKLGRFADDK